jgi:hypothetical protein
MMAPEAFDELTRRLSMLTLKARHAWPQNPASELGEMLNESGIDEMNSARRRDIARWLDVKIAGADRRTAMAAIAHKWITWSNMRRSDNKRTQARARAMELKRDAYASCRSVRDQRAYRERMTACGLLVMEIRQNRSIALDSLSRALAKRGPFTTFARASA